MDLVNDVNTAASYLGRDPDLFNQVPHIVHGVVGSRIQFVDIECPGFIE
jgi:hypothetical protein